MVKEAVYTVQAVAALGRETVEELLGSVSVVTRVGVVVGTGT